MTEARPLREVFADLAGSRSADPGELLAAQGHPDLPDELVAEAVVSYAGTAPVEVAEHLAPYVMAHSAVPTGDEPATGWHELLGTAPEPGAELDEVDTPLGMDEVEIDADPALGLDFGAGAVGPVEIEKVELAEEPAAGEPPATEPTELDWASTGADELEVRPGAEVPEDPGDLFD